MSSLIQKETYLFTAYQLLVLNGEIQTSFTLQTSLYTKFYHEYDMDLVLTECQQSERISPIVDFR